MTENDRIRVLKKDIGKYMIKNNCTWNNALYQMWTRIPYCINAADFLSKYYGLSEQTIKFIVKKYNDSDWD